MQSKITMSYNFTATRFSKINKTKKCSGNMHMEQPEFLNTVNVN